MVGENWKETTETHFVEDPMSCDRTYLTSYRCLWEVSSISMLLLIFIIRSHAFGQRISLHISRITVPQRINREDCRYYAIGRMQYNLQLVL
jgi:hypothetical protein